MIKHIVTADALIITGKQGTVQVPKNDVLYNVLFQLASNPTSSNADLDKLLNIYKDNILEISRRSFKDPLEVFFEGRYYEIPKAFADTIYLMICENTGFQTKWLANFVRKCLANSNVSFEKLIVKLSTVGFLFTSNGDVIFSCDDDTGKIASLNNHNDRIFRKLILSDPSRFNSTFSTEEFTRLFETTKDWSPYMSGSAVGNPFTLTLIEDYINRHNGKGSIIAAVQKKYGVNLDPYNGVHNIVAIMLIISRMAVENEDAPDDGLLE